MTWPIRAGILAVVLATAPAFSQLPPAGAAVTEAAVPARAREALNDKWPGWRVAPPDDAANGACVGGPFTLGSVVQFDADSDDQPDLAVAVQTPLDVRLAILLKRPWGYRVFDVTGMGERSAAGVMDVARRGQHYRRIGSGFDQFFANHTLTVHRCGAPVMAYPWTGSGFEELTIGGR